MDDTPLRLPAPAELGLPEHYELLHQLAVGRAGRVVYLARHTFLEREVCVKAWPLAPDPSGTGLERFRREARAAASMTHPNIVAVYDYSRTDRVAGFALEYVAGGSLERRVRDRGPLPLDEFVAVFGQACAAVSHVHEKGYLHRNVKPGDCRLTPAGQLKLSGFANAVPLRAPPPGERMTASALFMAPEEFADAPLDPAADVYTLGVLAYFLLTGAYPFHADTYWALVRQKLAGTYPPPSSLVPALGEHVDQFIGSLLALDAAARPATPAAGAAAARALLAGAPAARPLPGVVPALPAPLADVVLSVYENREPMFRFLRLFDALECLLRYLGATAIAACTQLAAGRRPQAEGLLQPDVNRPSLGHWNTFVRRFLGTFPRSDSIFTEELSRVLFDARGRPSATATAIDRLIFCRNRFRGHGSILPPEEYHGLLAEWLPVFEGVLVPLDPLARHELLAAGAPSGQAERDCLLLRGPSASFVTVRRSVPADVGAGGVLLAHADASPVLDLRPFLRYHVCETCGTPKVFLYSSAAGGRRGDYLDYLQGHVNRLDTEGRWPLDQ
jgi:serine/threonine protein kinase